MRWGEGVTAATIQGNSWAKKIWRKMAMLTRERKREIQCVETDESVGRNMNGRATYF
jgi:hypothetical protein